MPVSPDFLLTNLSNSSRLAVKSMATISQLLLLIFFSQSLLWAATPDTFAQQVTDGTTAFTANFTRFSNRGPNFRVVLQQNDGSLQTYSAPQHNTYIGMLPDRPGAQASAVRLADDSVYYRVTFEDGTEWIYDGSVTSVQCERDDFFQCAPLTATSFPGFVIGAGGAGSVLFGVEVGVDLPFHRYSENHNSDSANALSMIEYSIMNTNSLYMREAGIQHQLGLVVIRASQTADPYAPLRGQATTACQISVLPQQCDMLNEIPNQWDNVLGSTTHDMALVVNETGGAGLAAVGTVANPKGYSSNDASALGDFSPVFRHEGGHNWSLNHFDGGAPEGSTINSGNSLGRMSGPEQKLVVDFRNQQIQSFDNLGAASVAIPPQAATDSVYASNTQESIIDVLANDHDANGDALTLVAVTSASELNLGGTLVIARGQGAMGRDAVKYTAPNASIIDSTIDRFTYRIRDASGLESVGYIFVRLGDIGVDYSQNFNSFADGTRDLGDGSIMTDVWQSTNPTVQVQAQALRLTPDLLSQFGSFTVPKLNLNKGFQASFRFKISSASTPADGLVFNFGDPVPNSSISSLGGFGSGLAIEFNTFARPGYVVRVNNIEVDGGFVANSNFVDDNWHNVSLSWESSGSLTLTVDGTAVFTSLATTGFTAAADDMIAFSAKTVGLSELVLIDDVSVAALPAMSINTAPQTAVSATTIMVNDTNGLAGELVNLNATATDNEGNLQSTQWIVDNQVVATGTAAALNLPDGLTSVTFRATDSEGLSSSIILAVTVISPTTGNAWPGAFAGTAPDTALNLGVNNIGVLSGTDGRIYSCLRIYSGGTPSSLNGFPEYDIAFSIVDAAKGQLQVADARPFNQTQALASDGQLPACSGIFDLTSSEYTDTIQVGVAVYSVRFVISDPATLQFQVMEALLLN
ncbi:MAG: hypothetical protein ACJAS2_002762 [Pseudohongiellaceae bacterium]|jgi:hypothetical protein